MTRMQQPACVAGGLPFFPCHNPIIFGYLLSVWAPLHLQSSALGEHALSQAQSCAKQRQLDLIGCGFASLFYNAVFLQINFFDQFAVTQPISSIMRGYITLLIATTAPQLGEPITALRPQHARVMWPLIPPHSP